MAHDSSVITGIELEQFMDRLEAQQQEQDSDTLLAQLQAQALRADSLASIDRLHTLWMQAGDSAAARAVIENDGNALLHASPEPARAELLMNLAILRLRVASYLDDEATLLEVLEQLKQMATQTLDFNVEHYRRFRIFDELEGGSLEIALKTIEVRYALTLGDPARVALRAWDAADQFQRRARVLAYHQRDEEARSAALEAINALRSAGPDQDIDEGDWLWLGNALIEIIPLRLALFEQPIAQLTAHLSLPRRREWEVRTARLAARALHAQGDLAGALKICNAAALSLDSDGGSNFIEYELPWLMEAGRIEEAGHRAFIDVYERQTEMWPATARLILNRLQDPEDHNPWWPICVMRACINEEVLQSFLSALPELDAGEADASPLLAALHAAMDDPQPLEPLFAAARAEALRRAPEHPWIGRLAAVHDAERGLIDAASEVSQLQAAIQAGRMQDNRSAFSLFAAQVKSLGVIEALKQPKPTLASGMYGYNYAAFIDDLVEAEADKLPREARDQAYWLLREAQRDAYEQGQAHMERYFASGSGHPFDACAHLYSMLCNNLAINYRYYNEQNRYEEAIDLHLRGLAASSFAEHYNGLLSARIRMDDKPGIVEAAEQLWHYSAQFGYSRHDPNDYIASVAYALYSLDRDSEILIWLERLLTWQEEQGVSDQQLDSSALFARVKVARYLAHAHPDNADSLWQRYEPLVLAMNEVSVMSSSVDFHHARGRTAEAIDYCTRTLALCNDEDDYDIKCRARTEQLLAQLQAPAQAVGKKSWWQIWK
ncbi:hypothetical protein NJH83_17805 [Pseudomonas chlororaphis]|uniref:hypothetical protein n=1 Tax=Pseudomonas chlororaphis TaxID=587753 RepID=UPI00209AE4F1|nr:hypothetical protein [Pseudomonas chlororaphis]MCO7612091.1 hypothetical protein [Pseudomonas chlororaphis]